VVRTSALQASFVADDVNNIIKESIDSVLQNASYNHNKVRPPSLTRPPRPNLKVKRAHRSPKGAVWQRSVVPGCRCVGHRRAACYDVTSRSPVGSCCCDTFIAVSAVVPSQLWCLDSCGS